MSQNIWSTAQLISPCFYHWNLAEMKSDCVCLELVEAGASVAGVEVTGGDQTVCRKVRHHILWMSVAGVEVTGGYHRVEVRLCVSGTGRSRCISGRRGADWGRPQSWSPTVCLELIEACASVAGVELTGGDHRVEVRLYVSGTGRSRCISGRRGADWNCIKHSVTQSKSNQLRWQRWQGESAEHINNEDCSGRRQ